MVTFFYDIGSRGWALTGPAHEIRAPRWEEQAANNLRSATC